MEGDSDRHCIILYEVYGHRLLRGMFPRHRCISKVFTTNYTKSQFYERKEIHMQRNQSIHTPSVDKHKGKKRRECIRNITKIRGKTKSKFKNRKRDVNNPPNCG
jgi:hypothetical protein